MAFRVFSSSGVSKTKVYKSTYEPIFLNWDVEFHVHINASFLIVGVMLTQNLVSRHDYPIIYASRLLNKIEKNYNTMKCETLTMVFALHKFKHYLFDNKFVFYVDHMVLVHLVNKPQVSNHLLNGYFYLWNMNSCSIQTKVLYTWSAKCII
jgi:hypothetical protein